MGFIENIIMKAFDVAVEQKQKNAKKRLANDPQLKKHYADLDKSIAKIQSILKKRK
mgnify:CR=1 FL=1